MGPPVFGFQDQFPDPGHGLVEILLGPGPAGRMDAGGPPQGVHGQTRIVGQGRQAGGIGRRPGLDQGIGLEAVAVFDRLGQAEFAGRGRGDPEGRQQIRDLAQLARVVGGDDQPVFGKHPGHGRYSNPMARRCAWHNSSMPLRASPIRPSNCCGENGASSAVPWISTMPPRPVNTKLASAWADESSA